ncbi:RNA-directed DNA polymerase, eukaryota [Tanacetum coccineum]|uniref:RNA-directed DNA polymerase, eukaryota n=1 Tax=Tanacetum coccineum TaxID=301880 RepID=A0ABQ4YML5_9ASTR
MCSAYGTVVDVFIPFKKSKSGKRFAFVRFIKVTNLARLVENLCTIWIGRRHLYANQVRFERPQNPNFPPLKKTIGAPNITFNATGFRQSNGRAGSYATAVNGSSPLVVHGSSISPSPALVLADTCVIDRDLSKHAMGRVKDINSIPNLRTLLMDEETLDLEDNVDSSFGRKRLCIKTKHAESILESFKIIVKGKVFMFNSSEEDSGGESASDVEEVPETIFGVNSSSPNNYSEEMGEQHSGDPFKIYDILKKKPCGEVRVTDSKVVKAPSSSFNAKVMNTSQEVHEEVNSESAGQRVVNNGGSMLGVMEDMIRVGQAMGYSMDGCVKDFEFIIGNQGDEADYVTILIGRWNGEAIIMGDFNEVCFEDESRGSCFNPSSARFFDHFISSSGLVDVKLEGFAFTWSHPSASKMSKLDRFLVSDSIISLFPSITAVCLDRHLSDHRPILLHEVHTDFGPTLFWLYHSWFSLVGFDDMVEQTWHSFSHSDGNRMIRFKKKLQDLKVIIRCWVKDKRVHMPGAKVSIRNELCDIDKELDRGAVSDANLLRRLELNRQLHDINLMEAKDSIQKSKVKWAIEGDENSKFFHGLINKKRSQLAIRGVFVDGLWRTDPGMVKEAFFNHFEARFKKPVTHRLMLNFPFVKRLSQVQAADLERCVSRDEIRLAVWNCGDNKSPGPDGYTFEFFRKYWNFVGPDFCEAVEYFFVNGSFPKGCNSSFVALIPKVTDAKFVNDFRPISLIGCVYKVVTKVLANRLALVISDLVSDTQSAFVAGRQILDGPFILNEILHWCKRKKKQAMFFKVDFAGEIFIDDNLMRYVIITPPISVQVAKWKENDIS